MSEDPFDDLDAERDREGDPFTDLDADAGTPDEETDDETADGSTETDGQRLDDHPFSDGDDDTRRRRADVDSDDPFADMDVTPGGDPFEDGDWSTAEPDEDLWEDLSSIPEPESTTEEASGRRLSTVNKHSFCQQCEYFSGPPAISCAHEGTEILEFLDMETVRVADCPVVEERERLEEAGTRG